MNVYNATSKQAYNQLFSLLNIYITFADMHNYLFQQLVQINGKVPKIPNFRAGGSGSSYVLMLCRRNSFK